MKTISRYIMTLVLLLTAVTGAWADGTVTVKELTASEITAWANDENPLTAADLPGFVEATTEQAQSWDGYPTNGIVYLIYGFDNGETKKITYYSGNAMTPSQDSKTRAGVYGDINRSTPDRYFYVTGIEAPLTVEWNASTKTGSFVMPAFDVEIAPIYAPTAVFATDGEPTAIEGIIAGEAKDIVKAGIVAKVGSTENVQGTLMYLVTTTKEQPTSTTGFSATVPTGAALTGSYTENQTVYVWYYIKGIDAAEGVTPTAENTFNDSEICETPLTVKLKANQFTLTLDPAPVKNITVTAGTETKTPTTEGKTDIKMNSEVKLKANEGYKFRKVEVKKNPVAEGHALTSAKLGEIVCSDGKAYAAADKDILPKGVKAEALVCYVDGDHGLALAMADVKNEKMSWDNDRGANDGKTAAEWCTGWNTSHPITGATWLLASQTQWNNMINAAGSASNLSNAFSAVGGTNLQAWSYWSSTSHIGGTAAYMYYFPSSAWQWTYLTQDDYGSYIRACLEW